jgi:hypothetical protein
MPPPANGRGPTHAALVEGRDRHAGVEQVLSDRREEDVVVAIGRPRPGVHEDGDTGRLRRQPERAGKGVVAVANGEVAHARSAQHRRVLAGAVTVSPRREAAPAARAARVGRRHRAAATAYGSPVTDEIPDYLTRGLESSTEGARQLSRYGYLYALLGLVAAVAIGVALLVWLA